MRRPNKIYLLLIFTLTLSSCQKKNDLEDLKAYCDALNQRPPPAIQALPQVKTLQLYHYSHPIERDPFSPYISLASLAKRPDADRPKGPLENYPLSELKMMGTLTIKKQTWALIASPDRLIHATIGDYLGKNSGRILRITANSIDIQETIPNGHGGWQQREVTLSIGKQNV
jgi:type IV pilus assembly protein PilP